MSLLAILDESGIEVLLPRCAIIEIAAVSTRLTNPSVSEEICNEVETSFRIVPEERLIAQAKQIALSEGCPVLTHIFSRFPNRIQFLSSQMIWECTVSVNEEQSIPGFYAT